MLLKMFHYIGIEDLVASAMIELMKVEETNRKISLQTLSNYGTVVVKLLTKSGQNAILLLSKESTYDFVHDYADYFSIVEYNSVEYIELKDSITCEDLRKEFRKNLTVDLARAFTEKETLKVLQAG